MAYSDVMPLRGELVVRSGVSDSAAGAWAAAWGAWQDLNHREHPGCGLHEMRVRPGETAEESYRWETAAVVDAVFKITKGDDQ